MATTIPRELLSVAQRDWTLEEFERLVGTGFFAPGERLELIEGVILPKMTQNPPHATALTLTQMAMMRIFGTQVVVRIQLPLSLDERNRPEPDVAVVSGSPRDYLVSHPSTALLVVEISDTTLQTDRDIKAAIYARAEINEYWILNLAERNLEVHREPRNGRYNLIRILDEAQSVTPVAAPDNSISIAELLP